MELSRRNTLQALLSATAVGAFGTPPAAAQSRSETLRHVAGATPNGLDPNGIGAVREARSMSMSFYDRLVGFGKKEVPGGGHVVDMDAIAGELAEKFEKSADGKRYTFHIRPGATFHDGTPVTAADVKWSLDRGISAKTLAASFFKQASMTQPEQFVVLGERTLEIRLPRADRLTLQMLGTPFASIYNSALVKKNAPADDAWAVAWTKENVAGGGAFMVERYTSAQQLILRRNDTWKNGRLPDFRRVIAQAVPDSSTRANLLERGDADISVDLAATDVNAILQRKQLKVVSQPQFNTFQIIAFGTRIAPFDNPKVRKAVAMALPYQGMFQGAQFGRGELMADVKASGPPRPGFVQPWPVGTDLERAKAMLAEAGHPRGFATSFSFSVSAAPYAEPMAALIKESLGKIGIDVQVQKLPDAQFTTSVAERKLPMASINFAAYFVAVEYVMRTFFSGVSQHNYSGWKRDEIAELANQAQFETSQEKYDALARRMMEMVFDDMPVVMLWQPSQDAVMARGISGYTYQFHSQVDHRDLRRT